MSDRRTARALDRALSGRRTANPQVLALATVAQRLQGAFDVEVPSAGPTRAMFMQGVGSRGRSWGWLRVFAPATVTALILLLAMFAGRSALPGDTLYPVRQVLKAVGLAPITLEEIDGVIGDAEELLDDAENFVATQPRRAESMAFEAVKLLGFAEGLLPEVSPGAAQGRMRTVHALLARAMGVLEVQEPSGDDPDRDNLPGAVRRDDDEDEGEDDSEDDDNDSRDGGPKDTVGSNRGPGDDDRAGGSNNSGPGGDDDTDKAPDPEDDTQPGEEDTDDDDDGDNKGPGGGDTKDDDDDDEDTKDGNEGPDGDDDEDAGDDTIPDAEDALRGEGHARGDGGDRVNQQKDKDDGKEEDDDTKDDVEEALEAIVGI